MKNLHTALSKVYEIRKLEPNKEKHKLVWSIAKQISPSWDGRLYLIEGVKETDVEILKQEDAQLKVPNNVEFKEKLNAKYEAKAFDVTCKPLLDAFKGKIEKDVLKEMLYGNLISSERKECVNAILSYVVDGSDEQELQYEVQNLEKIVREISDEYRVSISAERFKLIWNVAKKMAKKKPEKGDMVYFAKECGLMDLKFLEKVSNKLNQNLK